MCQTCEVVLVVSIYVGLLCESCVPLFLSQFVFAMLDAVMDGAQNAYHQMRRGRNVVDCVMFVELSSICQQSGSKSCGFSCIPCKDLPPLPDDAYRVVCISDTHDAHRLLCLPPADVLIHAGDIMMTSRKFSSKDCARKAADFNEWLGEATQVSHKVVIGGNHDAYLESLGAAGARSALSNATFLEFEELCLSHPRHPRRVAPLWVYGAPFSHGHSGNDAYQLRRDVEAQWGKAHRRIPPSRVPVVARGGASLTTSNVPLYDIAVTHSPHMSHLDLGHVPRALRMPTGHVHVGGHLHSHYGVRICDGVPCVVACSMNNKYEACNPPIVFDYQPSTCAACS